MSKQPQPLRAFGRADAEEGAQRPAGGIGLGPVRGRHGVLAIPIAGIRIEAFARAMAARFCAIAPCARYQCRWRYGSRRHCVNVIRHGNRQSLALTFRRIEFPFSYSSSPVARIEQSEIRERQQRRHCEERSDEAIQRFAAALDCFAELVIGPATSGRTRWLAMTTKRNHSRDASASELCDHQATTKASFRMRLRPRMIPKSGVRFSDKIMRRKEGAKRRKAHPTNGRAHTDKPAHSRRSSAGAAARHADEWTQSASLIRFRARPPCGASPRHSPAQSQPYLAQPETRVSRTRPGREFCPPLSLPSAASSSRTGPSAGRAVLRAARGRIAFIRARAPLPLRLSGLPSAMAPSVERDSQVCGRNGDEGQAMSPIR